jgi:hypothetical protein
VLRTATPIGRPQIDGALCILVLGGDRDDSHGAAGQARLRVSRRPAQDSDLMPEHQDLPVLAVSLRREHELAGYPDHQQLHKEDEHERQAYDPDRATVRILA